jgi:hypothetical protein
LNLRDTRLWRISPNWQRTPCWRASGKCGDYYNLDVAEGFYVTLGYVSDNVRLAGDGLGALRLALLWYIERWYYLKRRHWTLWYVSSAEYDSLLTMAG